MSTENLRDAFRAFTTTCALLTTDGPSGPNVMAAEWTLNVSYRPFLILVAVDPANRTHDMILESKEFGVSLVADDQAAAIGFAGHYSKVDTDKLSSALFETYPATRIRAPLIRGAVLNAECRLVAHYPMGDHTGFVGEVLAFSVDSEKKPLVLHQGSHRLGERIVRDPAVVVAATPMRVEAGGRVVLAGELTGPDRGGKAVEAILRGSDGGVLASGKAVTDAEGIYRIEVHLPAEAKKGFVGVEAHSGRLRGFARIEVLR